MALLSLLVGPAAAGKSTWVTSEHARSLGVHVGDVVSVEQLAVNLTGDFRTAYEDPQFRRVFHELITARLRLGLTTVADAQNLVATDRAALRALARPGHRVRYLVVNRPLAAKLAADFWRRDGRIADQDAAFLAELPHVLAADGDPSVEVVEVNRRLVRVA